MMGHREHHMPKIKNDNSLEVQVSEDTESEIQKGALPPVEFLEGPTVPKTQDPQAPCPTIYLQTSFVKNVMYEKHDSVP